MNEKTNVFKMSSKEYEEYIVNFNGWREKVNFLKDDIAKLGKLDRFPIFSISAFSLKTQVIEFELKQLFLSLDLEIAIRLRISKSTLNRKIRHPKDFDNNTLGQTISQFCEYDGIVTEELKTNLKSLNTRRNKFVHHMFDNKTSREQLITNAKIGIELADKILHELSELNQKLDDFWKKDEK